MKTITFEEALEMSLTERQIQIAAGIHRPRKITRAEIERNFLEVFELVGGVPRLAMWANNEQNYGEFIKIVAKMLPKEALINDGMPMVYQSMVPPSQLNNNVVEIKERMESAQQKESEDAPAGE